MSSHVGQPTPEMLPTLPTPHSHYFSTVLECWLFFSETGNQFGFLTVQNYSNSGLNYNDKQQDYSFVNLFVYVILLAFSQIHLVQT